MGNDLQCDVCGSWLEANSNDTGLLDPWDKPATLCFLHAEAARRVARDGVVNWFVMNAAQSDLNEEQPDIDKEREAYLAWDPLPRLVELYREREFDPDLVRDCAEARKEYLEEKES